MMAYVQPDLKPWRDTSGKVIEGRRQWREHLKATDTIELDHAAMQEMQSKWEKRKQAAAEKTKKLADTVIGTWQEPEPIPEGKPALRLWCKVAERLEHRPTPPRKVLIKIILEELRRKS